MIFYDQQGCGNSDQPDDAARWTVDFYVREVDAVRAALGLDRCHILGQSWGGMLLMEYLVPRPAGVVSATIASSPASMPMWVAETGRQRALLPLEVIEVLDHHEAAGTWDDPEYEAAVDVFYERHVCRVVPMPEFATRSFAKLARNPQVYRTMNGPTEFHVVGTLREWEILHAWSRSRSRPDHERPPRRGDPDAGGPSGRALPQAEWVVFEQSGHMSHAEEPDRYMAVLADWLSRPSRAAPARVSRPWPRPAATAPAQRRSRPALRPPRSRGR